MGSAQKAASAWTNELEYVWGGRFARQKFCV